jgi:tetratricopeptide (TPR) repeat protein
MSFRFFRRFRIAPGVHLNLSKGGVSMSAGPRGLKATVGTSGRRFTAGIPGTGLHYTKVAKPGRSGSRAVGNGFRSPERTEPIRSGFWRNLGMSAEEKAFVEGVNAVARGDDQTAAGHLAKARGLPDADFLAGVLLIGEHRWDEAALLLRSAHAAGDELGRLFGKYDANVSAGLAISDEISVRVGADRIGVLLCLVEAYQSLNRQADAIASLEELLCLAGGDVVVQLSLAEFLMETRPAPQDRGRQVVSLTRETENLSELHAALLLYRGQALRDLGLPTAARDALTAGLRRRKDRRPEILNALRYERALVYLELKQKQRARRELEMLYAADPDHEDVAERLGLKPSG